MRWVQLQETDANNIFVSFCQMPFLLTPETKTCILQGEANLQKHHMVRMFNHLYDRSEFLDLRVSASATSPVNSRPLVVSALLAPCCGVSFGVTSFPSHRKNRGIVSARR